MKRCSSRYTTPKKNKIPEIGHISLLVHSVELSTKVDIKFTNASLCQNQCTAVRGRLLQLNIRRGRLSCRGRVIWQRDTGIIAC